MESKNRKPYRGYVYIAIATFLWGTAATIGRAAFTGHLLPGGRSLPPFDPLAFSQSRTTFSFLILLPILFAARGVRRLHLPVADFWRIFLLGILGMAASNYFYYLAIQKTNVATAIVVQYTAPIWVLLYVAVRQLQKPTLARLAAVVLALAGIALAIGVIGGHGLRLDRIGVIAALLAAFSFAFYNIAGHDILTNYDHWIVLLYTVFSASVFWIVVNPPWKIVAAHYSGAQWLFLLGFALISMLIPFAFYFAGLKYLEPTRAIVVSCLEPVFAILIAAIALGEVLRWPQIIGILLVLGAIVLVQMPDPKQPVPIIEPVD